MSVVGCFWVGLAAKEHHAERGHDDKQHDRARKAAAAAVELELKTTVAGLLLQSQLALSSSEPSSPVAEKLRLLASLAGDLRGQLSAAAESRTGADILARVDHAFNNLNNLAGKAGAALTGNEWLMSIRSSISIPGGTCEFDLPAYYAWQKLPAKFPRSDKVPDALFGMAQSHEALGEPAVAEALYDEVVSSYPKAEKLKDAKKALSRLRPR